jgi:acyl-CoA reductase-like NAD-dependent aldehyde dehydrogenase
MRDEELWLESYQGEVLGEALFGLLAERQPDEERRRQLEVLTLLERSTKELAEPVLDRRRLDRGDIDAVIERATRMADTVADLPWDQFLESFEAVIDQFLAKYRELAELVADEEERSIALAYISHEQALAAFARRALGREAGEPLEPILALSHVAARL